MRIVLITTTFPKLSETFIVSKFMGLIKKDWDVYVTCAHTNREELQLFSDLHQSKELRKRIRVFWPTRPHWLAAILIPFAILRCFILNFQGTWRYIIIGVRYWGIDVLRRLYMDAELIVLNPDLIHIEFGALAVERMHLRELLKSKMVISFRGYDINYAGLDDPDYYCILWEKADALHFLGEELWRRAQVRGCPPAKAHVIIPPAIDTDFFDGKRSDHTDVVGSVERPLRILSVGRLDWVKGYEFGLHAVRILIDRGVYCEYRIIGDGNYHKAVSFTRSDLHLDNDVRLLGAQSLDNVLTQMKWADIFLHPSVSEGFSNAAIEAQAMKLPVVCSDAGGLPENVSNGETGFVVPRRDPNSLAEKMILLARDSALRQRLGDAGRQRVLRSFSLNRQICAFEQLYCDLLALSESAR